MNAQLLREYIRTLIAEDYTVGPIIDPNDKEHPRKDPDILDTSHDIFGRWYRSPGKPPAEGNNFFVDDPKSYLGMTKKEETTPTETSPETEPAEEPVKSK